MVLLSTTHILKSQSQVGIRAGRSRSGFRLVCPLALVAIVRGCPPLFVTVNHRLQLFTAIKHYPKLPTVTVHKTVAVCHCSPPSATVRRRPPSPATSVFAGDHWIWSASPSDSQPHRCRNQPPVDAPPRAASLSAANRRVQPTRRLLLLGTSRRHLRSSRRSLLLLFQPSKLRFSEVQTSPLRTSPSVV